MFRKKERTVAAITAALNNNVRELEKHAADQMERSFMAEQAAQRALEARQGYDAEAAAAQNLARNVADLIGR